MIRQPFIDLAVPLYHFLHAPFEAAYDFFFPVFFAEDTLDDEEVLSMPDILAADGVKITFTKTKMVYGIEDICFSYPVVSNETIDFFIKLKFTVVKIFVINKRYLL